MHALVMLAAVFAAPVGATQEPARGPSTLIAPPTATAPSADVVSGAVRSVSVAGDISLNLHGDGTPSSEIDCPTKDGPGIQLHVQGDVLMVTPMHEGRRTSGRCLLTLHAPGVEAVQLAGASKMRGGALSELTEVSVGGAANLDLRGLAAPSFRLNVAGAGTARLSGTVSEVELTIAGAANIDATDLDASSARLTSHGAGNIAATVRQVVHATSAGAGTITVYGKPATVHETTAGIGNVIVK